MTDRAAAPEQPMPRLARLDLHGFKSFATRTVFAFEPGITAVVGPNGSGKSNIADAVRWVLGEASSNALRSKRTEDVIFAGGKGKSPSGMAEVTVTFNNEDHWLPSEFAEVTVTRRAFRGGDNQYFINGRRVRLKDVALLTASLGQSHTVVGQGLVDAALSQRADERRGLFEHAADLTGLRLKVADAERNLNEADANTARLSDVLNELEPRLRTLERAAKQAREWQGLRDRLTFLQRGHYSRLLTAVTMRLLEAEGVIVSDADRLAAVRDALERRIAERSDAQEATVRAREVLASHDARLGAVRDGMRQVAHERDLVVERTGALDRRREDMRDTQSGLDDQVARVEAELAQVGDGLRALTGEVDAARSSVQHLEATAQAERRSRSDLERESGELARTISRQERTSGDLSQRRTVIEQKRESARTERERAGREAKERADRIGSLETELAAFETEDETIATRIAALDTRLAELSDAATVQATASATATDSVAGIDRRLGQATNRLDVLRKVHESGTGLHAGVRQVMEWKRGRSLQGIRGTLAELIAVDAAYDTAIEVALGGHLQDIVVDRWRDAEAAIALLKRDRAGRATFQPLDNLKGHAPQHVLDATGVHGVAASLVRSDDDISPVVRALIGRTVVVDDLPAARRILDALPVGWSTVTLAGEIARSGGSVTGGSAVRESGVLGRERELRDLPDQIADLERRGDQARRRQREIAAAAGEITEERGRVESERAGLIAQRRERSGQHDRLAGWLHDLQSQRETATRRIAAAVSTAAAHDAGIVTLEEHERLAVLEANALRERHETLLADLGRQRGLAGEGENSLTAAQRDLAALEERLRAEHRRESSLLSQRTALAEEMSLRAERVATLDGERIALAGTLERLEREVMSLASTQDAAAQERLPLSEQVTATERVVHELEHQIERARQGLLERERALGQHELLLERVRSELATVHQRITDDLGLDDPDALQTADPGDGADPAWTLDPDHALVEREISRLRDRLRRVGYVGEDVVAEFERESEHHAFLRTQLADVQEAAAALRQMLAGLRETMRRRFEETFARVAAAFTDAFVTLFGGGTARLVLTTDDEGGAPGGIDIVAQPPGKRLQSLGLLSGGERSLTAVALLFAILRVNPSPFVLLDEVDAALDEANVVRFRDELRKLADETQAIVITHNRGTVEIADTLYGVTMGGDGVSQVLSLRLSEIPLDEHVDVRDNPSVTTGLPTR